MPQFTVIANLKVQCEVSLKAGSWSDALTQAQELTVNDFLEPMEGSFNDSESPEIRIISKED